MIVQSETLVDKVVKAFIEAATNGSFVPGEKLPIHDELQKMFGVGRNTLREALQRLESLGVVTIRQGDGTFLNTVSANSSIDRLAPLLKMNHTDLTELMEARKILEVQTAQLAALRSDAEVLEGLEALLVKMKENRDHISRYVELDYAFHIAIAMASSNSILSKFVEILSELIKAQQEEIAKIPHLPAVSYSFHERLVQAIREKDPAKAARVMEEHLSSAHRHLAERQE